MRLTAIACCGAVLLCAGTETYGEGESEDSSFLAADASASTGSLGELAVSLDSTNLPIVMITTGGQTIPYGTKITATMRIIDHAPGVRNHPTDPDAEYDGYIGIEVRGHFSATFPQQPYGLETRDALGNNLNVSLLGMPKENDWILTSNYDDKSLMRNLISFDWFRNMGHYATRARLCEVMLNGSTAASTCSARRSNLTRIASTSQRWPQETAPESRSREGISSASTTTARMIIGYPPIPARLPRQTGAL